MRGFGMVSDRLLSRRRVVAGSGGAVAALLGAGLFAPEWLPDPLTDRAVEYVPEPPSRPWRPPVTDEHADEAVDALAETVDRAKRLREGVDPDSVSEEVAFHLDTAPSGGWLDSAREASDNWTRLFYATYGLQFAGEAVGYALVARGEADPEALVERGRHLRRESNAVTNSVREYRVADPGRDLAFLAWLERELVFARLNSHRAGIDAGEPASAAEFSDHGVASTWGSHLQARQRLRNARRYRSALRDRRPHGASPFEEELRGAVDALTAALDEFPRRDEVRESLPDRRDRSPLAAARWELLGLCYDNDFRVDARKRSDLIAYRTLRLARALVARRAHGFVLDELDLTASDSDFDSGVALREKRRATRAFRRVRDDFDSPFAGLVAEEAANRIQAGDVAIDGGSEASPPWRRRVEAAVYYLVGRGSVRELPAVTSTVLDTG
jgi:hypothetical protein